MSSERILAEEILPLSFGKQKYEISAGMPLESQLWDLGIGMAKDGHNPQVHVYGRNFLQIEYAASYINGELNKLGHKRASSELELASAMTKAISDHWRDLFKGHVVFDSGSIPEMINSAVISVFKLVVAYMEIRGDRDYIDYRSPELMSSDEYIGAVKEVVQLGQKRAYRLAKFAVNGNFGTKYDCIAFYPAEHEAESMHLIEVVSGKKRTIWSVAGGEDAKLSFVEADAGRDAALMAVAESWGIKSKAEAEAAISLKLLEAPTDVDPFK